MPRWEPRTIARRSSTWATTQWALDLAAQHLGIRHSFLRTDRCGARHHHRHERVRSGDHDSGSHRSENAPRRSGAAGTTLGTLRARNGGVLVRAGQTEVFVDLLRTTGLDPSGVICEIMNDDGTMSRVPELTEFCRVHELKMVTVADLIRYRMKHERYVRRIAESTLTTKYGDFRMIAYASDVDHHLHVALVRGQIGEGMAGAAAGIDDALGRGAENGIPPLVRVHSHCLTGDVLGSTTCDCRAMLEGSLEAIAREERGVFVYLHHTGLGFHIPATRSATSFSLTRSAR